MLGYLDDVKFMLLFLLEMGKIKMEILQKTNKYSTSLNVQQRFYHLITVLFMMKTFFWLQLICE